MIYKKHGLTLRQEIVIFKSICLFLDYVHCIRHNSADSGPTSYNDWMKMASILNSKSRDLKHGGTFSNHSEHLGQFFDRASDSIWITSVNSTNQGLAEVFRMPRIRGIDRGVPNALATRVKSSFLNEYFARLKDGVKCVLHEIFINEADFSDCMMAF